MTTDFRSRRGFILFCSKYVRSTFYAGILVFISVTSFFEKDAKAEDSAPSSRSRIKDLQSARPLGTTENADWINEGSTTLKPLNKPFFGQVRFESMQYVTEVPEAPELTNSQLLSARLKGVDYLLSFPHTAYAMDVAAGSYFSWKHSHIFVNELYLKYDRSENSDITAGRRKFDWSELDTRWQLGLWQPKYTLDALRPEDQGLVGFFYDYRTSSREFLFMATPVFIPTMGPDVREEDGSLVTDSRWYRSPSNKWKFNNQETPIVYRLDTPDIQRLAANPGVATMFRWGEKSEGPRLSVGAAYKPVNDLVLKRQNFQIITRTNVTVSPEVVHHNLYSADIGYTSGPLNAAVSYMADTPENKLPEEDWVIQKLKPAYLYAANLDLELSHFLNRPVLIQTSYLRVFGGEIEDIEANGSSSDMTLFDTRLKFTNAVMAKVSGELARPWARPLLAQFSYVFDYDQKGSIWGLEFQFAPASRWALVAGVDLLGVEDENAVDKRFISQYRANDRYYGGMSYVF